MRIHPAVLIAVLLLAGCQSTPETIVVPEVVHVTVPKYIAPPAELTRPCVSDPLQDRTVESVVEVSNSRKVCEDRLNEQLRRIRELGESNGE